MLKATRSGEVPSPTTQDGPSLYSVIASYIILPDNIASYNVLFDKRRTQKGRYTTAHGPFRKP